MYPVTRPDSDAESCCACFPDNACKIAACTFAVVLVCAVALTIIILLPKDPGLNTTFYPVFGGVGAVCFVGLVLALVAWSKKKPKGEDGAPIYQPAPQFIVVGDPRQSVGNAMITYGHQPR
jgi:hypothetical protein